MPLFPLLPFVTLSYKLYIYTVYTSNYNYCFLSLSLKTQTRRKVTNKNIFFLSFIYIVTFPGLLISSCGYKLLSMSFHFYMKDSLKYFLQSASDKSPQLLSQNVTLSPLKKNDINHKKSPF